MESLPLITYPNPILKKKAQEISRITGDIKKLIPRMIATMERHGGIGLAGPQINVSQRIIIVQDSEKSHGFLNPKIIKKRGKQISQEEGCLSLPGIFLKVKRTEKIQVACQTTQGKTIKIQAEGLGARIFQHEIDHLNGILIINRTNFLTRLKFRKKLTKLKKI